MRKLAVSDSSSASDSDESEILQAQSSSRSKSKGKDKGKGRERERVTSAKVGKGKAKGKERESSKDREVKSSGQAKKKVLAISDDENDEDEEETEEQDDAGSIGTASVGSLHDADEERGLGAWTEEDGKTYLLPSVWKAVYEVDIIIRWRWHPRLHYPQYRVKWTDYPDLDNSWEPISCFDGDLVDHFWKDLEFAGLAKRPTGWDGDRDEDEEMLESDATERAISSRVAERRRRARKRKRMDIRKDRVEMRKAYARKRAREKAVEETRRQERDKKIEMQMKRKREEEEATAKKQPAKKVLTPATMIQRGGSSKTNVPVRPTSNVDRKVEAGASKLALAASYMTESDAKLKADKRKAKEEGVQRIVQAATRTQQPSLTLPVTKSEAQQPAALGLASTSSAAAPKEGETKAKGSYKGAHKDRKRMMPWNPLDAGRSSDATAAPTRSAVSSSFVRPSAGASIPSVPSTTVTTPSGKSTRPVDEPSPGENGFLTAVRIASPPPFPPSSRATATPLGDALAPSLPSPFSAPTTGNVPKGAIKLGGSDPRRKANAVGRVTFGETTSRSIDAEEPASSRPDLLLATTTKTSPPVAPGAASPTHSAQSPPHASLSPRDGQPSLSSTGHKVSELTAAEEERAKDAMIRWNFDEGLKARIRKSYNFVARYPSEDKEHYRLINYVLGLLEGARPPVLLAKHKEPARRSLVWVPSAHLPLTLIERQTLAYPNFRFMECHPGTGVTEIWPPTQRKVVMYTFAALMIKLIEQCYTRQQTQKWSVEDCAIMIHPWQKDVLQQLKDGDLLASFLTRILGTQEDLANKEFAVVEQGMDMLNEFEEIPLEWTNADANGKTLPMVLDVDLAELLMALDTETSATLHRLQYEKRLEWRSFTLIMAKTALACREVPTLYDVMQ